MRPRVPDPTPGGNVDRMGRTKKAGVDFHVNDPYCRCPDCRKVKR